MPTPTLPAELDALGYAVLSLLDAPSLAALARTAAERTPTGTTRFWSASRDRDKNLRRTVHREVLAVLEGPLRERFPDHRPVLCSLVAKPPGAAEGEVPLHQDWSFVDDRQWVSLNVWCPLDDVVVGNGCLQVVPGSHRSARQPRAAGSAFLFDGLESVLRRHLTPVPMRAGQALAFDHCLIHCSPANRSRRLRVAATAALLPRSAPMLYYHQSGPGEEVAVYEVPDDVHLRHDPGSAPPEGRLVGRQRVRVVGS